MNDEQISGENIIHHFIQKSNEFIWNQHFQSDDRSKSSWPIRINAGLTSMLLKIYSNKSNLWHVLPSPFYAAIETTNYMICALSRVSKCIQVKS